MFRFLRKKKKKKEAAKKEEEMAEVSTEPTESADPKAETKMLNMEDLIGGDDTRSIEITSKEATEELKDVQASVLARHDRVQRLSQTIKKKIETGRKAKKSEAKRE